MYGLLVYMQTSIHDFVQEAGSVRELAILLGLTDRKGIWRVAQWHSRGVIPWNAQVTYSRTWVRLSDRIARRHRQQVPA